MNDQPVAALKQLIQQYGKELTADPRRTEALLNDYCPAYRTEVFVLVNAQRLQIPGELLAAPKWMPSDAVSVRLAKRLQDRLAFSHEAADWAVHAWSVALGLTHNPTALARLLAQVHVAFRAQGRTKHAQQQKGQSSTTDVQSSVAQSATNDPKTSSGHPGPVHLEAGRDNQRTQRLGSDVRLGRIVGDQPQVGLVLLVASAAVIWILGVQAPAWANAQRVHDWLRPPSRVVTGVYPLPRVAWVTEGPLNVRLGPDMTQESMGLLAVGQRVRVSELSDDVQWSHIVEPMDGWVNNWYLHFIAPGDVAPSVQLLYREMVAATDDTPVYAQPHAGSTIVGKLSAGDRATTTAVTADDRWRQLVDPIEGWVHASSLTP